MSEPTGLHGAFRQSMAWLHTWSGLVPAILLYFVFVTGTFGYFSYEIDHWMQPELPSQGDIPSSKAMAAIALNHIETNLTEQGGELTRYFIGLPTSRTYQYLMAFGNLAEPNAEGEQFIREDLDPVTGVPISDVARDTSGGTVLYRMHYALHYLPYVAAYYAVGFATLFMFLAMITGVVTHKKIFVDFFTLRLGKGQRTWLDAHNMTSVLALPFMLMITYSGLLFFLIEYSPGTMFLTTGLDRGAIAELSAHRYPESHVGDTTGVFADSPALSDLIAYVEKEWSDDEIRYIEITSPGEENSIVTFGAVDQGLYRDRGFTVMRFNASTGEILAEDPARPLDSEFYQGALGLHEGRFANYWLRWAYFASGLLGSGMIATGLLLWAKKRRSLVKTGMTVPRGVAFMDRVNLGTIVGLPLGVAAYFWANRLLPIDLNDRAEWEIHCLFIVWALSFTHAVAREVRLAWREQVGALAAMCLLLPVMNALTTEAHFVNSLSAGDWERAGFDLTSLVFGLALCIIWPRLTTPSHGSIESLEIEDPATLAGSSVQAHKVSI
jgi:uncharacterized iron-regulated membrane protein|tara:strand:- start:674 stop:2329 length:1656 start_codon:yes stop_codon:yes gene_type:complete